LCRTGASVGDRIYVTGRLGAPATAIRLLAHGAVPGEYRERFAHPMPRIAEALWLADRGAAAAIDISDGLVADAGHLAAASGVRVEIDAAAEFEGRFGLPLTRIGIVTQMRGDPVVVHGGHAAYVHGHDHFSR
jgi:hypothetical protein